MTIELLWREIYNGERAWPGEERALKEIAVDVRAMRKLIKTLVQAMLDERVQMKEPQV